MARGTLTGYAYPTILLLWRADHTYVVSSHGHIWPCHGGSTGGRNICERKGDVTAANCLAQHDSEAGVVYMKVGVCHQMANRILYPARVQVTEAKAYGWSTLEYGEYGKDPKTGLHYHPTKRPWPELPDCMP